MEVEAADRTCKNQRISKRILSTDINKQRKSFKIQNQKSKEGQICKGKILINSRKIRGGGTSILLFYRESIVNENKGKEK